MKILIVDDSRVSRNLVKAEIGAEKYEFLEAENGREAVEVYKAHPDIALITLDVEMPEMDGFETCQTIRELEAQAKKEGPIAFVPIVFLTSKDTLSVRAKGFESGATDFLIKSQLKGAIKLTVDRILNPDLRWKGMWVAVVDTHELSRSMTASMLSSRGLHVAEFDTAAECFFQLKKDPEKYDMVITEHQLPNVDGVHLCTNIRNQLGLRTIPIIFVTAEPDRKNILNFFKCGATDYLGKPYFKEEFIARMNTHLNLQLFHRNLQENVDYLDHMNQIKDKVLSICSHDLRSPLNGILGMTQLLLEDESQSAQNKDYLNQIVVSGNYLNKLISQLLDVNAIQSPSEKVEIHSFDLMKPLDQVLTGMREVAKSKNVALNLKSEFEGTIEVESNETSITRIVDNLVSNALKFTTEGGRVDVILRDQASTGIRIEVIDNGVGIPVDKLEKLKAESTANSSQGTNGEKGYGLGFGIVKDLVRQLGGNIDIQSRVGRGTRIVVLLPLSSVQPMVA